MGSVCGDGRDGGIDGRARCDGLSDVRFRRDQCLARNARRDVAVGGITRRVRGPRRGTAHAGCPQARGRVRHVLRSGITVEAWPDLCRRIVDEGHEVAHHGYHHITPVTMEEAAEREQIEKGLEAIDRVLGGYRAVGYRSPGADLSANSTRLLVETGFIYESSMSAQDFEPYWCRSGDVIEPSGVAKFGAEVELLEIPFSWTLDDFAQMEFVSTPSGVLLEGLSDPVKCERMWLADLDYMVEEIPGGVYTMCFHPEVIGRGARVRVLERMIARAKEHGARVHDRACRRRALDQPPSVSSIPHARAHRRRRCRRGPRGGRRSDAALATMLRGRGNEIAALTGLLGRRPGGAQRRVGVAR